MTCFFREGNLTQGLEVRTTGSDERCSYQPAGGCHPYAKITPDGLCPDAFNALYPDCFTAVYAKDFKEVRVWCPAHDKGISFKVFRRPVTGLWALKNILKRILNLFYALDIIRYRVFIEVENSGKACPCDYGPGRTFELNLGHKKDQMCPAAANNVLAFCFQAAEIACPDHRINVRMAAERADEPKKDFSERSAIECLPDKGILINVEHADKACVMEKGLSREYVLEEIMERTGFNCLSAFRAAFPYYLTLLQGGSMPGFYDKDSRAAVLQCPSVRNKVELRVARKEGEDSCAFSVTGARQACPKHLRPGYTFSVDKEGRYFCERALNVMVPYINSLKLRGMGEYSVRCPSCNGRRAVFKIRVHE